MRITSIHRRHAGAGMAVGLALAVNAFAPAPVALSAAPTVASFFIDQCFPEKSAPSTRHNAFIVQVASATPPSEQGIDCPINKT